MGHYSITSKLKGRSKLLIINKIKAVAIICGLIVEDSVMDGFSGLEPPDENEDGAGSEVQTPLMSAVCIIPPAYSAIDSSDSISDLSSQYRALLASTEHESWPNNSE